MRNTSAHPSYLGFQVDWPVFVKIPFQSANKFWKRGDAFPWAEMNLDQKAVATLYASGYIYHNPELEKETKVGDRLGEMTSKELKRLVIQLNDIVKKRTTTAEEYKQKRCRQSTIPDKQRGLIRRFLRANAYIVEDFYRIRDDIIELSGKEAKEET